MNKKDFIRPSYKVKLGKIDDKWISILFNGKKVIDFRMFDGPGLPDQNKIVGWFLRTLVNLNVNSDQIKKAIQITSRQFTKKMREMKTMEDITEFHNEILKKVFKIEVSEL